MAMRKKNVKWEARPSNDTSEQSILSQENIEKAQK